MLRAGMRVLEPRRRPKTVNEMHPCPGIERYTINKIICQVRLCEIFILRLIIIIITPIGCDVEEAEPAPRADFFVNRHLKTHVFICGKDFEGYRCTDRLTEQRP